MSKQRNRKQKKNNNKPINKNEVAKQSVDNEEVSTANLDNEQSDHQNTAQMGEKEIIKEVVEEKIQGDNKDKSQNPMVKFIVKTPALGFALLSLVLNYFLEVLSRHSFVKPFVFIAHSPLVFLYNAFIIFVTLSLVMFAKRKVFATVFVCAMWVISAFANWIVLNFRTTPFSAIDILMIRNVMTMIDKYMTKWQMVLSAIGALLVIALLVYLYIRLPKSKSKRRPFRASAYVCMCIIMVYTLTKVAVKTKTVSDNFGNLAYAYNDYGFAYCFSNSIIDVGISKPKDYSEQAVHDITDVLDYNRDIVDISILKDDEEEQTANDNTAAAGDVSQTSVNTDNENGAKTDGGAETDGAAEKNAQAETDAEVDEAAEKNSEAETDAEADETAEKNSEAENDTETNAANDADNVDGVKNEDGTAGYEYAATKQFPNIIVIQLESIFDTKYMKDLRVTERVMPTYAKLKDNYSSGLFTVPAVGAGTANTEFEVQTGMSTQFFGAGEYPFKTIMKSKSCDSMAYDLKRLGYATTGFHNNDATFYERYIDYSNLGFDVFTGMEHMYFLKYTPRGWAKDNILDNEMLERMKQTKGRDYITTITVQAHGRYPKKHTETLTHIGCHFTGEYEGDIEKEASWEYYINQCRETDNMLKDLIKELEEFGEPTVVFMYGDHLPSLNLQETDLRNITLYQTEWAMWDNIGLKRECMDMTSYQASTYIFGRLGIEGGLMQHFHKRYMYQADHDDYLNKLKMLEYDTLYGMNYAFDGKEAFPKTDIKYGIRDIVIEGVEKSVGGLFVKGKGFNTFSEVLVDGKSVNTKYINYQTLMIPNDALDNASTICVAQVGDDHIVLSYTDDFSLVEQQNEEDGQTDTETDIKTDTVTDKTNKTN